MSALEKLSVMGSPRRGASGLPACANAGGTACMKVAAISICAASATMPRRLPCCEVSGFFMINPG
jgi:hypothetical protein